MGLFKIHEKGDIYYIVPTVSYLNKKEIITTPYDTNFLIYELFGYEPKDFIRFVCTFQSAKVKILKDFPYIDFYFCQYSDASMFLKIINDRTQNIQEKNIEI